MTLHMSTYGWLCLPLAINSVSGSKALVLGLEDSSLGKLLGREARDPHTVLKRTLKQQGNTNVRWSRNHRIFELPGRDPGIPYDGTKWRTWKPPGNYD
ncbi:hypothetical protein BDV40DRAFT_269638 [Aspergillus tamarii]|uniref:Uncharacterized protein n=1 Tax=Aspergillus tamarii TaxID=41984 RepID=A0A5N6UQN5_ASPTM|nr:hypothetical protein BDV40DRAFT_269638 [Aspergillus tamarii]